MKIERTAPGKVILCGEHSVVYGYPAIAVPVSDLRTRVYVTPRNEKTGIEICATDIGQTFILSDASEDHPLAVAVRLVLSLFKCSEPNATLTIKSQLPIASGMGSGAAVTVAVVRALSAFLGKELDNHMINKITLEVEKIYHGSPSGIDNTVITWERPIYYKKGNPPVFTTIGTPFSLLIASSGISTSTRQAVDNVRSLWKENPSYYEVKFRRIGTVTNSVRDVLAIGDLISLGTQLKLNHNLLVEIGVSISKLDAMVEAALQAGALGAKLTGSGQGGNIIALVKENKIEAVRKALYLAGSTNVWYTRIEAQMDNSI